MKTFFFQEDLGKNLKMTSFGKRRGDLFGIYIMLGIFGYTTAHQRSDVRCLVVNDTYDFCEICDFTDEGILDCHNRSLKDFKVNGSFQMVGLNMSYNKLKTTPHILDCINLVWIDLSYNTDLKVINEEAFRNIESMSLRIINLNNCGLLRISPLTGFVPNLEVLLIANNSLSSFDHLFLQNLEYFKLLDVRGNFGINYEYPCEMMESNVTILVEPSDCNVTCALATFCQNYYLRHVLSICQENKQCTFDEGSAQTNVITAENVTIPSVKSGPTSSGNSDETTMRNVILVALLAFIVVLALFFSYQVRKFWKRERSRTNFYYWLPTTTSTTVTAVRFQPKLDLPEIPDEHPIPKNVDEAEKSNVYYSAVQEYVPHGKVFTDKETYFIKCLKNGRIYNRWMGTITTDDVYKCVVFTTAGENAFGNTILNWNDFVKKTAELRRNKHLVNIEGISFKNETFYLVQEYLNCETLYVRLRHSMDSSSNATALNMMKTSEVMRHLLGILEGIQLLHSYDFLHPGLSTKKVLITNKGICKLYDFCLDNDAAGIIINKTSQMMCSINQFAPEALYRNEYTKACDVWSIAVVIWEMLSGHVPFTNEEQTRHAKDNVVIQPPQAWPIQYETIRNMQLFECWHPDCSQRPSVQELSSSFSKIYQDSINNASDDKRCQDIADGYILVNRSTGYQVKE